MDLKNNPRFLWIAAALLVLLLASWKYMLPPSRPTAKVAPGPAARMKDAP
jgi:hypothetical protein